MEPQDNNCELIDQLKQMKTDGSTGDGQSAHLVGTLHGGPPYLRSACSASQPEAKPFKEWIPQVDPYSGEANRAQEAFLAQFRLYAWQNSVPDTERALQLIGKLTCPAQLWYTFTFANDPTTATKAQTALGPCKAFERSGVCWSPGPPGNVPRHCPTDAELGPATPRPRPARGTSAPVAGPFGCLACRNPLQQSVGPVLRSGALDHQNISRFT